MNCCEKRTGTLYLTAATVAMIGGPGKTAGVAKYIRGSTVGAVVGIVVAAVAVMSDGATGTGRAHASIDGGSFAMLRSKTGVSSSSSSA
uniref:Uncharacterized protein n=1 Tax=Romanomermis culicivorax TaxID=13658 RepID=A0A915LAZ7_ROMCU